MIDAVRYEWVRIRTLRSTYWLTGLGLLLSAVIAGIIGWVMRDDSISAAWSGVILTGGSAFSPLPFTAVFMGIVGIFSFGHEFRHGTILATLTAVPRRSFVVVAKCLVIAAWSFVVAVVGVGLNWTVGSVVAGESLPLVRGVAGAAVVGFVCFVVLWGLLGLGLGSLLRNVPAAVVLLLVFPLIVEPLIGTLAMLDALEPIREAVHYLPFTAGNAMSESLDPAAISGGTTSPFGDTPSRLVSGLTFTAWVAALLVPAIALFHKRDS
ncbi:MAG TPA: hypothetical protein VIL34_15475 [Actinopolymorphaceae bacterium]|jgi:ABC-2 type transport system permease protein